VREWVSTLHHEWSAVWLAYSADTGLTGAFRLNFFYVCEPSKTALPVTKVEVHKTSPFHKRSMMNTEGHEAAERFVTGRG